MTYTFDDFKQIIDRLRGENGCPWDREQTCESLKPCMINETVEALAAIDILNETGDSENLCEELGDVLMQVVLLARIAEEEGRFTMSDVISGISEKMIRRHPHVFADSHAENSEEVLVRWEEIKKQEKSGQDGDKRAKEKAACRAAAAGMIRHLESQFGQHGQAAGKSHEPAEIP